VNRDLLYAPEPGDLVHRVCTWMRLSHNRGAALTAADVARKFGVATVHIVRRALAPGVIHGYLAETNPGDGAYFEAGPRLHELLAIPTTQQIGANMPRGIPNASPKTRGPSAAVPPLDVSKLTVEDDIPKPPPRVGASGQAMYEPLIAKLVKPGQSMLLPEVHAKRMLDWAKKLGAAKEPPQKYSVRKLGDGNARVWRDA